MRKNLKIKKQCKWLSVVCTLAIINCQLSIKSFANDTLVNNDYRSRAITAMNELDKSNHYVESLTSEALNELPIGLKRTISNVTYKIAIANAIFYNDHAELTAFAKIDIPQGSNKPSKQLFFGVSKLKLSYEGGVIGDTKLVLLGNISIPVGSSNLTLKGGFDINTGQAEDLTYISMDCNGFKEMGLSADISFPRSMLVPVDAKGNRLEGANDKVTSSFKTIVSDWNDILVNISLPHFEIAPLKGITFNIDKAIFDMSDLRNSQDITYPSGYEAKYMDAGNPALWQGIYVQNLSITLPKQFANRSDSTKRISFTANNMLIDNNGISGEFAAKNILNINQGSASGWRFSVDEFHINLQANNLTGAGFKGLIGLPVTKKEENLAYTACISPNNEYLLKVSNLDTLQFNVWKAQALIEPNSYIQLTVANNKFKPEAFLNGKLTITASNKADNSKPIANFKGIAFRGLKIKTDAPYLSADYFGYEGTLAVANFPVSIDNISLTTTPTQTKLSFGLAINLMQGKFGGKAGLNIIGDFKNDAGVHSWAFQKITLSTVEVNADFGPAFSIKGGVQIMEDNPTYGDAFSGYLDATFLKKITVKATALFGSTTGNNSYRYWFVDARATLPGGVPVVPPLNINGIGGGAYYHVKKNGDDAMTIGKTTFPNYIPDEKTGLGLRAAVMFNAVSNEILNGEASLEIAFNNSGGLNYIGLFGYAKFLGKLPFAEDVNRLTQSLNNVNKNLNDLSKNYSDVIKRLEKLQVYELSKEAEKIMPIPSGAQSGFMASLGIQYDFTQSSFHASFDLYVNAAGGLVKGVGESNKAGWAALHIAPGDWYLHMGTPTNRIGLQFGIGSFNIKTGSYLMVGSRIPGSPPPPQQVADILGVSMHELDYMRDLNALGDGRGFAFGSSLSVNTGDITFLILYANFQAGLGFDIMLKEYKDRYCKGSSSPMGINGWYANGQAYAYLQGELGVKVRLWFIKARIPIIKGAAAALLQAKLPNPSWFKGYLGVNFSVLGGLVKGNMRLKLTIGHECEIVSNSTSPIDVQVIADLTPKDKSMDIDVFSAPQASFNMRANQPFDMQDDNGNHTYRIKLEKLVVLNNNQEIPGRLEWNANEDAVTFYSTEILPPNKPLKALAKVTFEELKGGRWQTVYIDGKKSEELKEVSFTTGTAPTTIPNTNIDYAYPTVEQKNMYKDETPTGYIKLKRGQSYLFEDATGQALRFVSNANVTTTQAFRYDKANMQLNFNLPTVIKNQSTYLIDFYDNNKKSVIADSSSYNEVDAGEEEKYSVKNNQASEIQRGDMTKSILNYTFSTSKHNRFEDKMNSIRITDALAGRVTSDVINLQTEVADYEMFDIHELVGSAYTANKPLIQPFAILDDNYFTEDIFPRNYKTYPLAGDVTFKNRDTALLGLYPIRALPLMTNYVSEVQQNIVNGETKNRLPYVYNLPEIYKNDFLDIQNQIVNKYLGSGQAMQFDYLINGYYPFIRRGIYRVKYQYVLPDGKLGSSKVIGYENPIK